MAKISTYPVDSTPSISDKLIGTEVSSSNETKNYTIGSIAALCASTFEFTSVLTAPSTVNQIPSGLDTALQVSFGPAQGTPGDAVMVDANGTITFNQTGVYFVNGYGNIERQGSSGGVTTTLFRFLINGVQYTNTKGVDLDSTGVMFPYEFTFPVTVTTAGTTLVFEIMRDSSGVNNGGLYTHTNLGGWSNVPSAQINIWQLQ